MASITEFSRLSAILTLDIAGFLKNSEIAEHKLVTFGQKASKVGATLSRGLGLAFGVVGFAAVNTASEFNKVSVQLRALVGQGSFATLSKQAVELGKSTVFTRQEIVEAQKELAKLGTTGADIEAILPSIANLSGALDEDLVGAASGVKEALNIYSLGAGEAQRVTDLYAQAVQSSALTVPQLREGLKNIGPILAKQNLSLEDSVALLALLSNSAIKGSTAGTKLRSTFNKLAEDFPDANQAVANLTKGTFEYSEILDLLNSRAAVVGAILNDQGDDLDELRVKFKGAAGAADLLASEFEGELFFTVEQTKNAFQSLGIEIGTSLTPIMNVLRDTAQGLADFFSELSPASKKLLGVFVAMIPVVSGLTFVVGQMAIAVGFLAAEVTIATGGISLLVAAALALGVYMYDSAARAAQFRNTIQETADVLKKDFSEEGATTKIKELNNALSVGEANAKKLQEEIDRLTKKRADNPDGFGQSKFDLQDRQEDLKVQEKINEEIKKRLDPTRNLTLEQQRQLDMNQRILNALVESNQASEERIEINKKVAKVEDQAQKLLDRANQKTLPEYQQNIAEINRRFREFAKRITDAGGDTGGLEAIRKQLLALARIDVETDRATFIEDLQEQIDSYDLNANEKVLANIDKLVKGLREQAAELGILEQVEPLIKTLESTAVSDATSDALEDARKAEEEAAKELTRFLQTEEERRIADVRAAGKKLIDDNNLVGEERIEVERRVQKDIDAIHADTARNQQSNALRQLSGLVELTNILGQSFQNALTNGTSFFRELANNFLRFFAAIIGKLISLIALFKVLTALSGGTGVVAGIAGEALGGQSLSQFVGSGLLGNFRSMEGGGPLASRIDGRDLVLSNSRSGRIMDRIG